MISKLALFDLDGTLAAYDKAIAAEMAKIAGPNEPLYTKHSNEPYMRARRDLIRNRLGFWRELEPLTLGFEILEEARKIGYSFNILTQGPSSSPNAWTEKFQWCNRYLPGVPVTVTQNKALSYGRVLVDDFSPYFLSWLEHRPRGLVICVAHPWNEIFAKNGTAYQKNIFRYDGLNYEELRATLQEAYNR